MPERDQADETTDPSDDVDDTRPRYRLQWVLGMAFVFAAVISQSRFLLAPAGFVMVVLGALGAVRPALVFPRRQRLGGLGDPEVHRIGSGAFALMGVWIFVRALLG